MKILTATVSNFGSYKDLTVDFQDQGLTLVSGPTGAGKSTLCDIIPWILWGRTSKGGTVDEVRTWGTVQPTSGLLVAETNGHMLTVFRSRNPNDLYYITAVPDAGRHTRGTDLNDTQKLINDLLGVDLELYMASAYFNEFSQTAGFFMANAKTRRMLTEQLVDLSLATKVTEGTQELRKQLKSEVTQQNTEVMKLEARIEQMDKNLELAKKSQETWKHQQTKKINQLQLKSDNYGVEAQAKHLQVTNGYTTAIKDLEEDTDPDENYTHLIQKFDKQLEECSNDTCPTCGNIKSDSNRLVLMKKQHKISVGRVENQVKLNRIKAYEQQLAAHLKTRPLSENPYLQQLEDTNLEVNPFNIQIQESEGLISEYLANHTLLGTSLDKTKIDLSDAELLLEITAEFRKNLITSTISHLQTLTNKFLTDYFDAEIRVRFTAEDADKLDIEITKNGHQATFNQLSKGQRQLLKLCFGVSVIQLTQNRSGVSFNALFFDEALDGLDANLKVKAFRLLEYLATQHDSVFCVEHSPDLKELFLNRLEISLVNGESQIDQT